MSVTNNVLSVLTTPVNAQLLPTTSIIEELKKFMDNESHAVIKLISEKGFFNESSRFTGNINLVEFEEDVPFVEIPTILDSQNLFPASVSSSLDFLHALRGKENASMRRACFSQGLTLLSMDSLVIEGKMKYLVVGQDACSKREQDQRLFSIRLMQPANLFSCGLYRLITAQPQG